MSRGKHDWMEIDRYLAVLDACLEKAETYFVEDSRISIPTLVTPEEVHIRGELICKDGLVIHVDNVLERDQRGRVRGTDFRYQAQFITPPLRQIFRYDNGHVYTREGHPDAFHKHVFSDRTWRETEVIHIGREHFPTLAEVIDELYQWWLEHRDDTLVYF